MSYAWELWTSHKDLWACGHTNPKNLQMWTRHANWAGLSLAPFTIHMRSEIKTQYYSHNKTVMLRGKGACRNSMTSGSSRKVAKRLRNSRLVAPVLTNLGCIQCTAYVQDPSNIFLRNTINRVCCTSE